MSQTRLALTIAEEAYDARRAIFGQDFALECLLRRYDDQGELRAFVDEQLGLLVEHDAQHDSRLIETREALVGCRSRAAAAAELNIRRQSLYYRIRKIEALLQMLLLIVVALRTSGSAYGSVVGPPCPCWWSQWRLTLGTVGRAPVRSQQRGGARSHEAFITPATSERPRDPGLSCGQSVRLRWVPVGRDLHPSARLTRSPRHPDVEAAGRDARGEQVENRVDLFRPMP